MIEIAVEWTNRSVQTDELMWEDIKAVLRWNTSSTENLQQNPNFHEQRRLNSANGYMDVPRDIQFKVLFFGSKQKTAFVFFVTQSILTVNWEYFRDLFSMFQIYTHLYWEYSAINFTSQVLDGFKSNKQCRGIRNIEFDFMISV